MESKRSRKYRYRGGKNVRKCEVVYSERLFLVFCTVCLVWQRLRSPPRLSAQLRLMWTGAGLRWEALADVHSFWWRMRWGFGFVHCGRTVTGFCFSDTSLINMMYFCAFQINFRHHVAPSFTTRHHMKTQQNCKADSESKAKGSCVVRLCVCLFLLPVWVLVCLFVCLDVQLYRGCSSHSFLSAWFTNTQTHTGHKTVLRASTAGHWPLTVMCARAMRISRATFTRALSAAHNCSSAPRASMDGFFLHICCSSLQIPPHMRRFVWFIR